MLKQLRTDGFSRVKIDGQVRELTEEFDLDKKYKHDISVIVDRLVMKEGLRRRLTDSVETAVGLADGLVEIEVADGPTTTFSEKFACVYCGISLPEIEPRVFSFNSPHGACPACHGLGSTREIDPELVVPDTSLSIDRGALLPYGGVGVGFLEQVVDQIIEKFHVDPYKPVERAAAGAARSLPVRHQGRSALDLSYRNYEGRWRHYSAAFSGIVNNLQRRYTETDSELIRQRIEEYMSERPCPECHGARLKPTSLAVTVGERNIHDITLHRACARCSLFLGGLSLTEMERLIGGRIIKEIRERLTFLNDVGWATSR